MNRPALLSQRHGKPNIGACSDSRGLSRAVVWHLHALLPTVTGLVHATRAGLDLLVELDLRAGQAAEGGPAVLTGGAGNAVLLTDLCALALDVAEEVNVSVVMFCCTSWGFGPMMEGFDRPRILGQGWGEGGPYIHPQLVQHWSWPIRLQSSFVFS